MTALVDIANRALQMLGTRTIITALGQDSNEAQNLNLTIQAVINWSYGLANWNFARRTAVLALTKGPPGPNPGAWTPALPSPPWQYQYSLPADYIRAIYATDSSTAANSGFLGEPKRFVIANDSVGGNPQAVVLSNTPGLILVYTGQVSDPTYWPWYFERVVVIALAMTVCLAITGDKKLYQELAELLQQQISISTQSNAIEGLIIEDSTPEWIQAIGINYPSRRFAQPSAPARHPRGRDDNTD